MRLAMLVYMPVDWACTQSVLSSHTQCSRDRLQIYSNPDQDKAVSEDGWMAKIDLTVVFFSVNNMTNRTSEFYNWNETVFFQMPNFLH